MLSEVGLVEALSIAVAEQPGDLLLQHRPDHLRQLLTFRDWKSGSGFEVRREMTKEKRRLLFICHIKVRPREQT